MRTTSLLLLFFVVSINLTAQAGSKSLEVSENACYFQYPDGSPFLWIGDTAWELFHRLNREEAVAYLENRKSKGINVIQAVILAENDGLRSPNAYGDLPLLEYDPEKPNEAYFEHVDFIVDKAMELGLFIGLLPTWGDKVYSENPGAGPVIFNIENAAVFGEYLGKRYKDKNIIWILGGDRNVANEEVFMLWRAMAMGIKKGDKGRNLISFHPRGASISSHWFHNEDWLDINMYQSGHGKHYNEVYAYADHLRLLYPRKPFVDGEPAYEDIPVEFWKYMDFSKESRKRVGEGILDSEGIIQNRSHFQKGFFDDVDVRVHGYWNILAGACGYTYGNNAIWQMYSKDIPMAIPCLTDWKGALNRPGVNDLQHLKRLFEKRSFYKLIPDQSIIYGVNKGGSQHIQAALADDKSFLLVYLASGQEVKVNMEKIAHGIAASWYDPRKGDIIKIGDFRNSGIQNFTPPSSGHGNDWMLILDDKTFNNPEI